MTTVWIRRPTAPPVPETAAPRFTIDGPVQGLRAGIRTDAAWRSWRLIAADWEERLRADGVADVATVETHGQVGATGNADRSHIEDLAGAVDFAIVGLGTCGSCTSFAIADAVTIEQAERPVVAVVTDEFATHGHNMASHLGHGGPSGARAAVPARGPARRGAAADRGRCLSRGARSARRGDGMRLTGYRIEVPADPAGFFERSLAEQWGDGVPLLPPTDDAIEALLAATPDPPDHVVGVLPPGRGVATVELVAANAAMAGVEPAAFPLVLAALDALLVPEWNAFGLTTTTSSVFPMLIVNGPSPRRARHRLPRRLHGRRGRPRVDDDRPGRLRCACATSVGRRAGETSRTGLRPAGALRHVLRRMGGAVAVAVARGTSRLAGLRRRRDRARWQGHVPDGRHPQRRPA